LSHFYRVLYTIDVLLFRRSHVDKEKKNLRKTESVGENGTRNGVTSEPERENEAQNDHHAPPCPRDVAWMVAGGVMTSAPATISSFRRRATR